MVLGNDEFDPPSVFPSSVATIPNWNNIRSHVRNASTRIWAEPGEYVILMGGRAYPSYRYINPCFLDFCIR